LFPANFSRARAERRLAPDVKTKTKKGGASMRRNFLPATLLIASCAVFFCACGANDTRVTNASSANSNAATNTNAATGAREGAGPHDTGIGGTGEDNRSTVAGNSNVEPTGVNKNAGSTPANHNR
jgi:uncharacterized protein (UPF0333 family)